MLSSLIQNTVNCRLQALPVIGPSTYKHKIHAIITFPGYEPPPPPLACIKLNSIYMYYDVIKFNCYEVRLKPENAKRILISTAIACFEGQHFLTSVERPWTPYEVYTT